MLFVDLVYSGFVTEWWRKRGRMAHYRYSELAATIGAFKRCSGEWKDKHQDRIDDLMDAMPSGSGFDNGTRLDMDASHDDKLVFTTSYHHMNENGYYDGWTDHTVTVTPAFNGFHIRVSGRNRNDIKDYIGEVFHAVLSEEISR